MNSALEGEPLQAAPERSGTAATGVPPSRSESTVRPRRFIALVEPDQDRVLIGRLTADPVCHPGEKHESATFRLAVPRPGSDSADFLDIVTFDKLASTCADWLSKGRQGAVVGRLRLNEWTTPTVRCRRAPAARCR